MQKRNSLISVDDALAAHSLVQNQHTSQTNVLLFEMILRKVVPAIHTEFNNKAALRLTVTNLCAVRRRHLRDHAQCGATPYTLEMPAHKHLHHFGGLAFAVRVDDTSVLVGKCDTCCRCRCCRLNVTKLSVKFQKILSSEPFQSMSWSL